MRVTLPTTALLEAVGHAASVAAAKSPKPVLECIALRADRTTGLRLEATDLDVGIRIHVGQADVTEEGDLIVPATRLLGVVREVGEDEVTLGEEDGSLVLSTGRSLFRVRGEDPEAFVDLPRFPSEGGFDLPGDVLKHMIRRTVFATAKEAGRYALHGVLFQLQGSELELVATDGRRLARMTRTLDQGSDQDLRVIVGPKGLSLLDRILGGDASRVRMALQERQGLVPAAHLVTKRRLIDGTFPAYEDVIPARTENGFEVAVVDFADALRRVALLTTRDAQSVQFDIGTELLTIRSRAPEVGEAKIDVPITYDGPATQMGFNPGFLSDALKVMGGDTQVRFEFQDGKAPGRLSDEDAYVYVVMPIALE